MNETVLLKFQIYLVIIILIISMVPGCINNTDKNDTKENNEKTVKLIYINATINLDVSGEPSYDAPPRTISTHIDLPHNSDVSFWKNDLIIYTDNFNKNISTVIIIQYWGYSFSNHGDNRFGALLLDNENISIKAALNSSEEIYKIRIGTSDAYIPSLLSQEKGNVIIANYQVYDYFDNSVVYKVQETHNITEYYHIVPAIQNYYPGK